VQRATVLIVAAFLVTGCARRHWTSDHPDVAVRAQAEPQAFVGPALQQWAELQSLAGSYSIRVAKGIGRGSADLAIAVRRPADVDINILGPTGAPQAYLRANAREVGLSFGEERVLYRGPSTGGAFERALGFDLSAAHVVATLLGYGIPEAEATGTSATWDADARRIRVDTVNGTQAWLHPVTRRFDQIERGDVRGMVTATLTSWLTLPPVPDALRLQVEPDGYGIELSLSGAPTVNPEFPPGFFEIDVPPGFEVRALAELAQNGGIFGRLAPEE